MSKLKSPLRHLKNLNQIVVPNKKAFDFLDICSEAKISMTSSSAPIKGPPKINLNSAYYGYAQSEGISKGDNFVINKCVKFFNQNGIKCSSNNVSLNDNILSGIAKTYKLLDLEKKDKVLVPSPTFGYYFQQFRDEKIGFEIIATEKENGFLLDPNDLEIAIKRTNSRVLLLCYPNNPTGVVMTQKNAEEIAEVVKQNNVFVISDEVFIGNTLNQKKRHFSIASVPGMLDQSITLTSVSKMMNLTGIRTSFCVGAEDLVKEFGKLGGYSKSDQEIIAAALENNQENQEYLEDCRQKYLANITLVKNKINDLNYKFSKVLGEERFGNEAYIKPYISDPEAGNVYLLDFSGLRGKIYNDKKLETGLDIAEWLLEEASVAVVPGECFMFNPEDMLIRIALGHPQHEFEQAFEYADKAAEKIQNSKEIPGNSPSDAKTDRTLGSERVK